MQNKSKNTELLPNIVVHFYSSVLSRAFRKIQLFQRIEQGKHLDIRHYDLQCQAVSTISSILQNKIQALQIKAFLKLKTFKVKQNSQNKNKVYSTHINSQILYSKTYPLKGLQTIGSQNTLGQNYTAMKPNKSLQQYQKKIREILSKVKQINENPQYNFRYQIRSPYKQENESLRSKSRTNIIYSARKQKLTNSNSITSPTSSDYLKLNNFWNRQLVSSSPMLFKDR